MFSFRQKIFIGYTAVFFILVLFLFPIVSHWVHQTVIKAMDDRATEIITNIKEAPNNDSLVRRLKDQKSIVFFRVSVITNDHKVLYDSHTKRLLGPKFSQDFVVHHPEVDEAEKNGTGYHEEYSSLLGQKFAYFAKSFDFHHKTYVLRTAFPHQYVTELTHDFIMGFLILTSFILLLFSFVTWLMMHKLTRPIRNITSAVESYKDGQPSTLPVIDLQTASKEDEFGKLAFTINSLSSKVKNHIDTLTNERNEKEAILESLIEGVIAVDSNLQISYVNQTASKFIQKEVSELIDQPFSIVKLGKCEALLRECQSLQKPLTSTLEISNNHNKIYLDIVAAPKKENGGAILVLQDKTTHYKLFEMQRDFIANASHELKTPITIIRGFAEAIHDHPELPVETQKEITGKIVKNCKRMATLIKDLLALADIEKIPLHKLTECDISAIVENCFSMILEVHPDSIFKIEIPEGEDALLLADPDLLELALFNLIENATKYSEKPAEITVEFTQTPQYLTIKVRDKGIGIPKSDQPLIFERFYTVDKARSQKMGGSGLGLSIVKTIVEKHGGNISLESELGEGSTFTIVLPIRS